MDEYKVMAHFKTKMDEYKVMAHCKYLYGS